MEPSVSVNFSRFAPSVGLAGLGAWDTRGDGAQAVAVVLHVKAGLVSLPESNSCAQKPAPGRQSLTTVLALWEQTRSLKKRRSKGTD